MTATVKEQLCLNCGEKHFSRHRLTVCEKCHSEGDMVVNE